VLYAFLQGCIKFFIPAPNPTLGISSPFGKLFKRGGKKNREKKEKEIRGEKEKRSKEKTEEKRQKGRKKRKGMVDKKGRWEAKKDYFVVKSFVSFFNWDWEGYQDRLNNIHP